MGPTSQIYSNLAFDPSKQKMVNIINPMKKRVKTSEFNAWDFLRTRLDSGIPIRFQSDIELEADLDILMEPEKTSVIDSGLRKIARALTVLNSSCNYRILDVHSERVIR